MGKIKAFVIGGIVGAAAALLLTPRNGAENLAYVKEKAGAYCGNAMNCDLGQKAQQVASEFAAKGQVVAEKASEVARSTADAVAPQAANDNDELRQKIEAARARIAAQMVQNAEESQAAIEDVIPVEAEVEAAEKPAEEPAE